MDEQQVRALVRQAIARHLGPQAEPVDARPAPPISQARFALVRLAGETECVIEPAVTCNHCGYCQCYGH